MNAAFLLVTSALIVGQPAPKTAAPPAAAPAPIVASSCGSTCGTEACCESFGSRLRDKWRGLFHRDSCDTCKPASCVAPKPACDDCGRTKWFNWQPHCREKCAPAPTCDSCESSWNILGKLRGRFHHSDSCCDSGCNTGSCGTAAPPAAPVKTEKIEAPKKMPEVPKTGGKQSEVRIEIQTPPTAPSPIQVAPTAPVVEVVPAPAPAPRIGGDSRDPF